jgi:transcriptional regulator with XRE-family HTH domain
MSSKREALKTEFNDPEARRDYAELFGNSSIALQIKVLRLQRGMTQEELAKKAGMKQSRISAMERADYSSWNIKTLRRLAEAFDLALVVSFESFGTLLNEAVTTNRKTLERPSFDDDPEFKPALLVSRAVLEAMPGTAKVGDLREQNSPSTPGFKVLPTLQVRYG